MKIISKQKGFSLTRMNIDTNINKRVFRNSVRKKVKSAVLIDEREVNKKMLDIKTEQK